MKTPHVHAELIKQWADNPSRVVQRRSTQTGLWFDEDAPYEWLTNCEYRFKPEPKPDSVIEVFVYSNGAMTRHDSEENLRLTFSGETGELIKAEVL